MKKLICLFVLLLLYNTSYGIEYKDINVPSAVVIDNTTHRILYDKNCHEKRSIASLTKVLTSILLVEACNLDEVVTVPNDATWIGGSEVGLKKNDNITVYNLLVGMLLPSGNDCAYTTAIHVGGNIENFAKMMTDKAIEIGCLNSSFANPHGLDNESHYSTAYDMALITSYALKNKTIADIVSSKSLNIKFGNTSKNINNTNRLLSSYPYTNGVKTGYTALAERCLITSAIKDDFNIITVVLGATTTDIRFNTAKKLMEDTYNIYKVTDISNIFKFNINLDVRKSKLKIVKNISRNFICPLKDDELDKIYVVQEFKNNLKAPLYKNEYIGNIKVYLYDDILYEENIYLENDIKKNNILDYLLISFKCLSKGNILDRTI